MERATEIVKYANLEQLEKYMELIEVRMHTLRKKHKKDLSLELEHSILSKRFNELLDES